MPSRWLLFVLVTALAGTALVHAADHDRELSQQYLGLYTQINDAEEAERHGDFTKAIQMFQDIGARLGKLHDEHPDWETALVLHRLADCRAKLLYFSDEVPGSTVTTQFVHDSHGPRNIYPWKKDIPSSEFWIGESTASAWNKNWVRSNSGADTPNKRDEYGSAQHASSANTFYVALPFNDLTAPDKAKRWLPQGWERTDTEGEPVSACQNRWVEIKNAAGDVCYAQWEDVGPGATDDAEYVFGTQPPKAQKGICISPAVADYLHVDENAPVSWRFVDAVNVQPGAWLKYDEEAVLFRGIHSLDSAKKTSPALNL